MALFEFTTLTMPSCSQTSSLTLQLYFTVLFSFTTVFYSAIKFYNFLQCRSR